MDDREHGTRNARGDWAPKEAIAIAPVFVIPLRLGAFLRWLPGYFLPWNAVIFAIALGFWAFLTPAAAVFDDAPLLAIGALYARNAAAVLVFYGGFELRLYLRRRQGTAFKYNPHFPADKARKTFLFGNQSKDGMVRTFLYALPIWSAYEAGVLWAFANGYTLFDPAGVPLWWLIGLGLLVPVIHEFLFYVGHRALHVPWLYQRVHAVHHKAVNPSPWSSLAMHPAEHVVYFSSILVHLVIASHPLLAIYQIAYAGFGAIVGHLGFDKIVVGDDKAIDTHAYAHYLHHKYFEVNYGDGLVPLDHWFGTWHDGTPDADRAMRQRRMGR